MIRAIKEASLPREQQFFNAKLRGKPPVKNMALMALQVLFSFISIYLIVMKPSTGYLFQWTFLDQ